MPIEGFFSGYRLDVVFIGVRDALLAPLGLYAWGV